MDFINNSMGALSPIEATSSMTKEVGQKDGKLYTEPPDELPDVTTADNGKLLEVVNGTWQASNNYVNSLQGISNSVDDIEDELDDMNDDITELEDAFEAAKTALLSIEGKSGSSSTITEICTSLNQCKQMLKTAINNIKSGSVTDSTYYGGTSMNYASSLTTAVTYIINQFSNLIALSGSADLQDVVDAFDDVKDDIIQAINDWYEEGEEPLTSSSKFDDFVEAIEDIPQIDPPSGTISITTNGTHNVATYASANVNVPNPSTGTLNITSNGTYDVTTKATAEVAVPGPSGTINITSNGTYDVTDKATAEVAVPGPSGTINITSNGTYDVTDKASAQVEVSLDTNESYINTSGYFTRFTYDSITLPTTAKPVWPGAGSSNNPQSDLQISTSINARKVTIPSYYTSINTYTNDSAFAGLEELYIPGSFTTPYKLFSRLAASEANYGRLKKIDAPLLVGESTYWVTIHSGISGSEVPGNVYINIPLVTNKAWLYLYGDGNSTVTLNAQSSVQLGREGSAGSYPNAVHVKGLSGNLNFNAATIWYQWGESDGTLNLMLPSLTSIPGARSDYWVQPTGGLLKAYIGSSLSSVTSEWTTWATTGIASNVIEIHIPAGESTTKTTLDTAGVTYIQDYDPTT